MLSETGTGFELSNTNFAVGSVLTIILFTYSKMPTEYAALPNVCGEEGILGTAYQYINPSILLTVPMRVREKLLPRSRMRRCSSF